MEVTVLDRQSMLDIAIQCLGGIEGVFALAERNGLSITSRLEDRTVLQWEIADIADATTQTFYQDRGLAPATEITDMELAELLGIVGEVKDGDEYKIPVDKIDEIIADLESGNEPDTGSDSGISLTRIFADEFDSVFA